MTEKRGELKKSLSPVAIWSIALGTIIGFGCFVMPGDWLKLGGLGGIIGGFALGGAFMIVISRSYSFMVEKIPVAGGASAYAYCSLGRMHSMIVGWGLVLAYGAIVPLNATALSLVGRFIAPELFMQGYLYTISGWDVYILDVLIPCVIVLIYGCMNYIGIKEVGNIQTITTFILVGAVLVLLAGALTYDGFSGSNLKPFFAPGKTAFASIAAVLAITPWAFCGFDTIPQSSEEFGFDYKKTSVLLVLAIVSGGLMYVATSFTTAAPMPWTELVDMDTPWTTMQAVKTAMGTGGVVCLVVAAIMGVATGINGQMLSSSRVLFSMGRAQILPEWFAKVNKHGTPGNAVIFITVMSMLFPWIGRQIITWIVNMAAVGNALGYGYTCLAAYLLTRHYKEFATSAKRFSFLLGGIFALLILVLLLVPGMPGSLTAVEYTMLGIWCLIGAGVYNFQRRRVKLSKEELDRLMLGEHSGFAMYRSK